MTADRVLGRLKAAVLACGLLCLTPAAADLLIGNSGNGSIARFDTATGLVTTFVAAGTGGLTSPLTMAVGPDGHLYVGSGTPLDGQILRFDGATGQVLDRFDRGASMALPTGMAFGPDGRLYVASSRSDRILRYHGQTGAFIDVFATGTGAADGLNGPVDLRFGPDGALYVATMGSVANADGSLSFASGFESQILRYDLATGARSVFVRQPAPFPESFGFVSFEGLAFAPDGRLWSSDLANGLRVYDATGALVDSASTGYTGTLPANNLLGDLVISGQSAYVVGFDLSQGNVGSILRFDVANADPQPGFGNSGALVRLADPLLVRPIAVVVAPPSGIPAPGTLAMLLIGGLALTRTLVSRRR